MKRPIERERVMRNPGASQSRTVGGAVVAMISIGEVLGEPEQDGSPIDKAIRAAGLAAIKLRAPFEIEDAPGVNVVFHVPGQLLASDRHELRVERFSRKRHLLLVSVPVPKELVCSDSNAIKRFVIDSLHAAIKLSFQAFHKKGIEFPLANADALVDEIERELQGGHY